MSEAPQSRRARRAAEEDAADLASTAFPAFGVGAPTGEIPVIGADGQVLSRRDRRRMERLAQPMETWTAEEEMIATGQIPVLTPERIAEQERIAREQAERAAQDALIRSRELGAQAARGPIAEPIFAPPAPQAVAPQPTPQPQVPQAQPQAQPQAPADQRVYVQPYQPLVILDDDDDDEITVVVPAPQLTDAVLDRYAAVEPAVAPIAADALLAPAEPENLPPRALPQETFGWEAAAAQAGVPVVQPNPIAGATAQEAPAAQVQTPVQAQPVSQSYSPPSQPSEELTMSQLAQRAEDEARARAASGLTGAQQPAWSDGAQGASPAPAVQAPSPWAAEPVQGGAAAQGGDAARDSAGADEIRRLAAEAISGIEKASRVQDAPWAAVATPASGQVAAEPGPSMWAQPQAQAGAQPAELAGQGLPAPQPWDPSGQAAASPFAPIQPQSPADAPLAQAPWEQQSSPFAPQGGPLSAVPAALDPGAIAPSVPTPVVQQPTSQGFDVAQAALGSSPGFPGGPSSAQTPQSGANPAFPPSGQTLAFPPQSAQGFPPQSAQGFPPSGAHQAVPPSGAFPATTPLPASTPFPQGTEPPATTGSLAAIRRMEVPDKPDPRAFKWLHLGVIGALMFVLGVVIYNVTLNQ